MRILFLVNDSESGVMGLRARNFAGYFDRECVTQIRYREGGKASSIRAFNRAVKDFKPDLLYVMNVGYAAGLASLWARLFRGVEFFIDHGDPSYELLKNSGRPTWEAWLVRAAEWTLLNLSRGIVARGRNLADELSNRFGYKVIYVPDGVESQTFKPMDVTDLRRSHGLEKALTVGVAGSIVWSDRHQICYGWDIIDALPILSDLPVKAIIVGDGTGLPHLKERARRHGVEDRVLFTGRVSHDKVPEYINLMDVCVSTQTNDSVGKSRTTAKLPEYLACGRFIIATDVGGAAELISSNGFLLPYHGIYDATYPGRLAEKIAWLHQNPEALERGLYGVEISNRQFEYANLARRVLDAISGKTRTEDVPDKSLAS